MKRVSLLVVFALFAALAPASAGELDEQVRRLYRTYETDARPDGRLCSSSAPMPQSASPR